MSMEIVKFPRPRGLAPEPTTFTNVFWTSLEKGEFKTTRCGNCETLSFPPRRVCIKCGAEDMAWENLSGSGNLYTRTRIHAGLPQFGPEPIDVAIVDLAEGIRLVCALVGAENARIDGPIELVVLDYEDGVLFGARPVK